MNIFNRLKGFTIIELLTSLAIIGIVSALAVPSWIEYVKKSRRSDAIASLMFLQLEQEKWRANDTNYATMGELDMGTGAGNSADGYYTISIPSGGVSSFTAVATPIGAQSEDKCGNFAVNQDGPVYVNYANADCWGH